jgi:hypothetical protein
MIGTTASMAPSAGSQSKTGVCGDQRRAVIDSVTPGGESGGVVRTDKGAVLWLGSHGGS